MLRTFQAAIAAIILLTAASATADESASSSKIWAFSQHPADCSWIGIEIDNLTAEDLLQRTKDGKCLLEAHMRIETTTDGLTGIIDWYLRESVSSFTMKTVAIEQLLAGGTFEIIHRIGMHAGEGEPSQVMLDVSPTEDSDVLRIVLVGIGYPFYTSEPGAVEASPRPPARPQGG